VTEQEWECCTDPTAMLEFLQGRASDRKLRLFAVACCRRIWHLITDERSRRAIEVSERLADGLEGREQLVRARGQAREAKGSLFMRYYLVPAHASSWRAAGAAQDATRDTGSSSAANCVVETSRAVNVQDTNYCDPAELQEQAVLIRCIFGNRFRPVALDPAWLAWHGGATVRLARAVYEERELPSGHLDAARLAVLADMLEEAGCSDPQLLGHLRGPGPHVRGCWAVDLVLGKT
jgi:hypothetical protein